VKLIVHLLHDQPTGPRIAKIDQWSGRALCVPRNALDEVQSRKELDGPCLYFLVVQTGVGTAPRVYVGEADGFRSRIKTHVATKDWWSSLVVFYSGDGSLTKSGIQYLESRCVAMLRDAGWCALENGNAPGLPTVPDEDVGGLEVFLKNVTIIMPVLGYNLFAEAPASDSGSEVAVEPPPAAAPFVDTIVCPARDEGFDSAFLGQHAWWAIRIGAANIPKIRYIAMYRVAPISAITHYGEVDRIEPYVGGGASDGKYKLILKGDPVALPNPVKIGKNSHLKPQGPKYAQLDAILHAKTLDDLFAK
jgi:hypothetical protein